MQTGACTPECDGYAFKFISSTRVVYSRVFNICFGCQTVVNYLLLLTIRYRRASVITSCQLCAAIE